MPQDSTNITIGMVPLLAQSIKKDIDAARNHLTMSEKKKS
jgi:hypothetical protein